MTRDPAQIAAEWAQSWDLYRLISMLGRESDDFAPVRKWHLFGVACCRYHLADIEDPEAHRILELSEAIAEGIAALEELDRVSEAALQQAGREFGTIAGAEVSLCVDAIWDSPSETDYMSPAEVAEHTIDDAERLVQLRFPDTRKARIDSMHTSYTELLKDIFGNPFRPVAFDPAWRTEHTVGIAGKMYDERAFAAMPILADALEEAGCDSHDILTHCREPGVHVRGCWVVDLVLGK